jgi:hypothetical protein
MSTDRPSCTTKKIQIRATLHTQHPCAFIVLTLPTIRQSDRSQHPQQRIVEVLLGEYKPRERSIFFARNFPWRGRKHDRGSRAVASQRSHNSQGVLCVCVLVKILCVCLDLFYFFFKTFYFFYIIIMLDVILADTPPAAAFFGFMGCTSALVFACKLRSLKNYKFKIEN